jgi:hypothetical protein
MAKTYPVRVATEIAAPASIVWGRICEHAQTPSWVDAVKSVTVVRSGVPAPNGLGAIRVVVFKSPLWSSISEEITLFDPPHTFHYVLFRGMPGLKAHLGKLIVDDLGNARSRLRWEVDFTFYSLHPFRLLVPSFLRTFEGMLERGVANLKTQFEGAGAAP